MFPKLLVAIKATVNAGYRIAFNVLWTTLSWCEVTRKNLQSQVFLWLITNSS